MLIYLILFATGFANEALLTSYYANAARGQRWRCVALTLAQQAVACVATFYTIVDVPPMSREQLIRWAISAASYGCATFVVVRPTQVAK